MQSNRLREWRLRTRHSQREVAIILNCTTTSVTRHETGERGLTDQAIRAYATLYKVPTYALFVRPALQRGQQGEMVPNCVHQLRTTARLTVQEVALLIGLTVEEIERIEQGGAMTHETILALASVFKLPTYRLFVSPYVAGPEEIYREEENLSVNPLYEDEISGDHGTPYAAFTGGYAARHEMATGR